MTEANYKIGETFNVQFIWRIPSKDFLRALFVVEVLHQDFVSDKYVVRLNEFLAGRQEDKEGTMRSLEEVARDYWYLVKRSYWPKNITGVRS